MSLCPTATSMTQVKVLSTRFPFTPQTVLADCIVQWIHRRANFISPSTIFLSTLIISPAKTWMRCNTVQVCWSGHPVLQGRHHHPTSIHGVVADLLVLIQGHHPRPMVVNSLHGSNRLLQPPSIYLTTLRNRSCQDSWIRPSRSEKRFEVGSHRCKRRWLGTRNFNYK